MRIKRSVLSVALSGLLTTMALGTAGVASAQDAAAGDGKVGDPDSWVDDEFKADWGLAAINAQYAYARGLTGKGIRLGVFDSGVDLRHGEFAGKSVNGIRIADVLEDGSPCANTALLVGPEACFMSEGDTVAVEYFHYTDDDRDFVDYLVQIGYLYDWVPEYLESLAGFSYQTHGTHVAGTMVANRDGQGTHGVAFAADLTTARLFSNSYSDLDSLLGIGGESYAIGPDSSAVESMYAQMNAAGVRAINHSWGLAVEKTTVADMDAQYGDNVDYFDTYVQPSLQHGILQVFAAGNNDGKIAGVYATLPRYVQGLEKYWLSVVNVNLSGDIDASSSICGQTMGWCVAAPGTDITSTVVEGDIEGEVVRDGNGDVAGLQITSESPEYGYGDMTGTSMATPHVTGALALLMERFPYLDNPQIRDVLLTTTTDLGAPGVDEIYGWGLIDLKKAIDGPGMLRVDTDVVMNQRAGGVQVWEGAAWDDWSNDIGGPGKLGKDGIGWLRLSGDNSFAGASVKQGILELTGDNTLTGDVSVDGKAGVFYLTDTGSLDGSNLWVNQGVAMINGTLTGGRTVVGAAGTLGGSGTLGDLEVRGTLSPGNSIGTLTVTGDYVQKAGSTYLVELLPPSSSDTVNVAGSASIEGGTLKLVQTGGNFLLGQQYTLLTAAGGVSGAFDALDTSAMSPFLKPTALFSANGLQLAIERGQALASAANTANQKAVATAADGLGDSSGLLQRLVLLSADQAPAAFDQLGGELHASARSLLVQDSRQLRNSALARARHGQDAFTAQGDAESGVGAWAEVQHGSSRLDADGNAAQAKASGSTTLVGADLQLDGGWRFGVLGGTGRSDIAIADRGSKADVDGKHAGAYVGQHWGGFGVRAGYAQSWQTLKTHRKVDFTGLQDSTYAKYDGTTEQAFVEAGYRFGFGRGGVEPFAQYAQVRVKTDAARESGGLSALALAGDTFKTDLAVAGVRFNADLAASGQAQSWLSLRGSLAWQRANGDRVPVSNASWNGGGSFAVTGAPLVRNATLAELGVAARLSANTLLELGYTGMLADEGHDTGLNARFSVQF
ncbi:autotransporter domain-containing protein [Stenotrophomonas daejeonensis]|uniref:autotransporter domain-containing protein n=1 Tax=Stenotrophomonas daejeonensis TaxID=659018 RepID=UPI000B315AF0|nr:autotransporter serine protease [Stenotrophomonas daejeonensis]